MNYLREDFMECDTCRAKLGSPYLCRGCVYNRDLVNKLNKKLNSQPDSPEEKKCCENCYHDITNGVVFAIFQCEDCPCHSPEVSQAKEHTGLNLRQMAKRYGVDLDAPLSEEELIDRDITNRARTIQAELSFIERKIEEFKNRRDDRNILEWLCTALEEAVNNGQECNQKYWLKEYEIMENRGRLAERAEIEKYLESQIKLMTDHPILSYARVLELKDVLVAIRERK